MKPTASNSRTSAPRSCSRISSDDSEGKRHAIEMNNVLFSAMLSSLALDQRSSLRRDLTLVDPIEGSELLFEVIARRRSHLA